jgi:hypothetical protein
MDLASLTADVWKGPMGLLRIAICVGLLVFFFSRFFESNQPFVHSHRGHATRLNLNSTSMIVTLQFSRSRRLALENIFSRVCHVSERGSTYVRASQSYPPLDHGGFGATIALAANSDPLHLHT